MRDAARRFGMERNGERRAPKALSEAAGEAAIPASKVIRQLISGLALPGTLRDVGIKREHLPDIAKRAMGYQPVRLNPRPIESENDVMEIGLGGSTSLSPEA